MGREILGTLFNLDSAILVLAFLNQKINVLLLVFCHLPLHSKTRFYLSIWTYFRLKSLPWLCSVLLQPFSLSAQHHRSLGPCPRLGVQEDCTHCPQKGLLSFISLTKAHTLPFPFFLPFLHLSAPASLTSAQLLDQLVYTGSLPSSLPILFFFFPLFILKIFKLTKKLKENIKHVHALP